MALLDVKNRGKGDAAISEMLPKNIEDFRMALRRRLIASRGSSYTYKNPDYVADRAGASIGDDGTINFNVRRPSITVGDSGGQAGRRPSSNPAYGGTIPGAKTAHK